MKKIHFLLVASLIHCTSACSKLQPGQVKVDGGIIQGTVTEDLTIYKGIPFAAPPVAICDGKRLSLL